MKPANFRVVDNQKYVWDGDVHHDEAAASRIAETYRQARFDVQIVAEGGEYRLFTRREAAGDPSRP